MYQKSPSISTQKPAEKEFKTIKGIREFIEKSGFILLGGLERLAQEERAKL